MESPPAKFLELGMDLLLTGCFVGGWKGNSPIALSGDGGQKPLEETVREKYREGPILREGTVKEKVIELPSHLPAGNGWLSVDRRLATENVFSPTATVMDKADFLAYVKQEGQKADDAKVPTHLWSFFFRESLLLHFGTYSGTRLDWKRDHPNVYRRHDWRRRI